MTSLPPLIGDLYVEKREKYFVHQKCGKLIRNDTKYVNTYIYIHSRYALHFKDARLCTDVIIPLVYYVCSEFN